MSGRPPPCSAKDFLAALQALVDEHGDRPLYLHDPDTDWLMPAGLMAVKADEDGPERFEITSDYHWEPDGYVKPSDENSTFCSQEKP
jgi:hypothetical protein